MASKADTTSKTQLKLDPASCLARGGRLRQANIEKIRHFSLLATVNWASPSQRSDREGRQSSLKRDCRAGQDAVDLDPTDASHPSPATLSRADPPQTAFGGGEVDGDQREVSGSRLLAALLTLVIFCLFSSFPATTFAIQAVPPLPLETNNAVAVQRERSIRLIAPWDPSTTPESTFVVSFDGGTVRLQGTVADREIVLPRSNAPTSSRFAAFPEMVDASLDYDCLLFAWSRSPLAIDFEAIEIRPDGSFSILSKPGPSQAEPAAASSIKSLNTAINPIGFQIDCEIEIPGIPPATDGKPKPLYIAIFQIDAATNQATQLYYSVAPATLEQALFSSASFALLDQFPASPDSALPNSSSQVEQWRFNSNFKTSELELRRKWARYRNQPQMASATQRWYGNLGQFPDAELFLERSLVDSKMVPLNTDGGPRIRRLIDARSEPVNYLLGQNWSLHVSHWSELSEILPFAMLTSPSGKEVPALAGDLDSESIRIWLMENRLHIAVTLGSEPVFWGSAECSSDLLGTGSEPQSLTITSEGSLNSFGYELFCNGIRRELIAHNHRSLSPEHLPTGKLPQQGAESATAWPVHWPSKSGRVDFFNTSLTEIEILSLDPSVVFLSWAELNESQRDAWKRHFALCVDPEGRYYLESLKHYVASQAQELRRSKKATKN
ncbi:hypothetical protein SH449x_002167 [Pirellulaceae bacterium SH449]